MVEADIVVPDLDNDGSLVPTLRIVVHLSLDISRVGVRTSSEIEVSTGEPAELPILGIVETHLLIVVVV